MRMVNRAGLVAAVALVAVVAAAPATEAAPTGAYVALGDSYTAGPLIPDQVFPFGCLKSNSNYPNVVKATLGAPAFRDASCSGARTDHMTTTQDVSPNPDNPPQLDSLDQTTSVVTLGIGGNDIGFAEIVQECATSNPFSTPCRDTYVVGGVDEITRRINATAPKVAAVLAAIKSRSPQAGIFVVGYPTILPNKGIGCWPKMPIGWGDVPYLRAKTKELNSMLKAQAIAAGVNFVDTYTPSIGKDACASASTRWVEPIVPATWAAPVHPNARGMQGIGGVVRTAIG